MTSVCPCHGSLRSRTPTHHARPVGPGAARVRREHPTTPDYDVAIRASTRGGRSLIRLSAVTAIGGALILLALGSPKLAIYGRAVKVDVPIAKVAHIDGTSR